MPTRSSRSGLSMPHSPRWYADRLWLLESGGGSLGYVDLATGRYEAIVRLAGFTRGLDFWGDLAFVGLSQVRETAVFSGIEITERLTDQERICGVWVIDLTRGETVCVSAIRGCPAGNLRRLRPAGKAFSGSRQRQPRADRQHLRPARSGAVRRARCLSLMLHVPRLKPSHPFVAQMQNDPRDAAADAPVLRPCQRFAHIDRAQR